MSTNLVETALGIIALGGAGTVLYHVTRWTYRAARRVEGIHHLILTELSPNGGNSLRDQVSNTNNRIGTIDVRVQRIEEYVARASRGSTDEQRRQSFHPQQATPPPDQRSSDNPDTNQYPT